MTSPFAELAPLFAADHPPVAWSGAAKIPWHDPEFSERMLAVHLDQDTHMASRSREVIDGHVSWLLRLLADRFPGAAPLRILDAGCGPGLYCHELARRGARAVGVDFAPASLRWARGTAADEGLDCDFIAADLRDLPPDLAHRHPPFHAATLWFCEFHAFTRDQILAVLRGLAGLIAPDGLVLIEYQPRDDFVRENGTRWSVETASLLCPRPHLWLQEYGWDEDLGVETHVHWIVEAADRALHTYTQCHQAYRPDELAALLADAGLRQHHHHPPITGLAEGFEFPVLVAVKDRTAQDPGNAS